MFSKSVKNFVFLIIFIPFLRRLHRIIRLKWFHTMAYCCMYFCMPDDQRQTAKKQQQKIRSTTQGQKWSAVNYVNSAIKVCSMLSDFINSLFYQFRQRWIDFEFTCISMFNVASVNWNGLWSNGGNRQFHFLFSSFFFCSEKLRIQSFALQMHILYHDINAFRKYFCFSFNIFLFFFRIDLLD